MHLAKYQLNLYFQKISLIYAIAPSDVFIGYQGTNVILSFWIVYTAGFIPPNNAGINLLNGGFT